MFLGVPAFNKDWGSYQCLLRSETLCSTGTVNECSLLLCVANGVCLYEVFCTGLCSGEKCRVMVRYRTHICGRQRLYNESHLIVQVLVKTEPSLKYRIGRLNSTCRTMWQSGGV